MALGFPVHAAQVTQVNQADQPDQAKVSQQSGPFQTETNLCRRLANGRYWCF